MTILEKIEAYAPKGVWDEQGSNEAGTPRARFIDVGNRALYILSDP